MTTMRLPSAEISRSARASRSGTCSRSLESARSIRRGPMRAPARPRAACEEGQVVGRKTHLPARTALRLQETRPHPRAHLRHGEAEHPGHLARAESPAGFGSGRRLHARWVLTGLLAGGRRPLLGGPRSAAGRLPLRGREPPSAPPCAAFRGSRAALPSGPRSRPPSWERR